MAVKEDGDVEQGLLSGLKKQQHSTWTILRSYKRIVMIAVSLTVLVGLVCLAQGSPSSSVKPVTPTLNVPAEIQHSWAQYSPYFAADQYRAPSKGCEVTQVRSIELKYCVYALIITSFRSTSYVFH